MISFVDFRSGTSGRRYSVACIGDMPLRPEYDSVGASAFIDWANRRMMALWVSGELCFDSYETFSDGNEYIEAQIMREQGPFYPVTL